MTEKEIRDYFDDMDRQKGLGKYAKEKQEMKEFVSDEKPDSISPFERRQLRMHATQMAYQRASNTTGSRQLLNEAEDIFQWIINPE